MANLSRYCTLAVAKDAIKSNRTTEDPILFKYIASVSRRIDKILNARRVKEPFFAPSLKRENFRLSSTRVNSNNNTFDLYRNLLEIQSITVGSAVVTSKIEGYPQDNSPFRKLQLTSVSFCDNWYSLDNVGNRRGIEQEPLFVTGIWGYHYDYTNAWINTSLVKNNMADDTTTITLPAGGGLLFSPGHTIKVDDEFMEIISIDSDILTVTRALNGTTAAAHIIDAVIYIWDIDEDIQYITARQAAALLARRGQFKSQELTAVGVVNYPSDLMADLIGELEGYLGVA